MNCKKKKKKKAFKLKLQNLLINLPELTFSKFI